MIKIKWFKYTSMNKNLKCFIKWNEVYKSKIILQYIPVYVCMKKKLKSSWVLYFVV